MYKKDKYGEYRCLAKFIDAWAGGDGVYVAGWCTCEVREYAGGVTRLHRGKPSYVKEKHPSAAYVHSIYMMAAEALGL